MKSIHSTALACAALFAGCAQVQTRTQPKYNMAWIKHPFVVHLLTDGRGIDRQIAQALRARGYDATFGALPEMPDSADAAVYYQDNWASDFTTYLIGIDIQVRTPRTDKPLAIGHYFKPSFTGRPPSVAIDKVIDDIFPQKAPLPPLPSDSGDLELPH